MSIIKSIKQQLGLGGAASEQHFWDGSVANQLTLKRGTPDAPGTELIKALNGVLSFPNQGQSLTANGYANLPGGLVLQWGFTSGGAEPFQVTFPTAFTTGCLGVQCTLTMSDPGSSVTIAVQEITVSSFKINRMDSGATTVPPTLWFAIGY